MGTRLLGESTLQTVAGAKPGIEWLFAQIALIWQPLIAGCMVVGTVSSLLGYWLVQLLWFQYILHRRASLFRAISNR